MHTPSLLFYIHGFNSSPLSFKAELMREYCEQHRPDIQVIVPQLPNYPQQAAQFLFELVSQYSQTHQIGLVGSSLGGYFSTWLHSQFELHTQLELRVVLVNPAVKPYELLSDFLGEQTNPYTNETYTLAEHHIDELKAIDVENIHKPECFWLLQQTADEVLDYHQAAQKFIDSKQTIEEGGDHSFVGFERYPEKIIEFLQL